MTMRWYDPGYVVELILSESFRWWSVCSLTYSLAVGARAEWLKSLLKIGIVGIPLALFFGTITLIIITLLLRMGYRDGWEPASRIIHGRTRYSLTDILVDDLRYLKMGQFL